MARSECYERGNGVAVSSRSIVPWPVRSPQFLASFSDLSRTCSGQSVLGSALITGSAGRGMGDSVQGRVEA